MIPFKPRFNSKDWLEDSSNLNMTIRSILGQTAGDFKVFVVVNELPHNIIRDYKVEYLIFRHNYLYSDHISDLKEILSLNKYHDDKYYELLMDQGRKQLFGSGIAKVQGFKYVMCIDSDDFVNKHLVSYISSKDNDKGWVVNKGYIFLKNKKLFYRQPYSMNYLNGSTHIIPVKYIPEFKSEEKNYRAINFFSHHTYLKQRMIDEHGVQLSSLPFYGIIYNVHGANMYVTEHKLFERSFRGVCKRILRFVPNVKNVMKNFNLQL